MRPRERKRELQTLFKGESFAEREVFLLLHHFSLQMRIFWSNAQTAGVCGKLVWPKVFIKMMDRLAAPIILLPFSTTQPPQPPPQALPSCCQSVFGCFFRVLGVVMT